MTRSTRNSTRTILTATLSAALAFGGVPAPALAEVAAEAEASQTTEESDDSEQQGKVAGGEQGELTADEPGEEPNEGKADEPDAGEPTAGEPGEEPSEDKVEEPSEDKVEEPDEGKAEEPNAGTADKPDAGTADEEPSEKPASTKKVEVPRAAKDLVYDGAEKVGVAAGEGYTLSGNASATAAGDYVAVATPADGYVWADGTTAPVEVRWSIARRDAKVRADAKTKAAGEEDPELTATVEGLVEGDELEYKLTREPGEEPGEYAITPAGDAEQGSYRVAYEGAKLKVTEKAEGTALTAQALVASGTWGTCKWQYDTNKRLTVYPGVADSASNVPWKDLRDEITSVRFASQGSSRVVLPANCSGLFKGYSKLATADLYDADTSRVENMSGMFENCTSLTALNIPYWNTSKVKNMDSMFYNCTGLGSLDLSGWDTSSVTDMDHAFNGCTSLTSLNLSGWDTTSVAYRYRMIYNCPSLQRVNVTGMRLGPKGISFYGLRKLSEIRGISGVDTSRVEDMGSMFEDCPSLVSLDVSHWNTSKVWNMDSMFYSCTGLGSLDLSG
ncbi:MAG: BspA family leucine-rich repeat surface protein, partial [Atopobiaceae bacterium]|nr:BspA family leucine-rich repeat surface protein [Atopobiaceae bacterium]